MFTRLDSSEFWICISFVPLKPPVMYVSVSVCVLEILSVGAVRIHCLRGWVPRNPTHTEIMDI